MFASNSIVNTTKTGGNEREIFSKTHIYYSFTTTRKLGYTDELGYYRMVKYDHIHYRYEPIRKLCRGDFGDVIEAKDHKKKVNVAIKIMRHFDAYPDSDVKEILLNEYISVYYGLLPVHSVARFFDHFVFRGHSCLVFELLYGDLTQLLETNPGGLFLHLVRDIIQSTLFGLLQIHDANIIHNDIKTANIMLREAHKPFVKIIDFGLSQIGRQEYTRDVQSIFYRSPEVILQLPYDFSSDMWSIGCVTAELYLGRPLFRGSDNDNQLGRIMQVLGTPPQRLVKQSPICDRYFSTEKIFQYSTTESTCGVDSLNEDYAISLGKRIPGSRNLKSILKCEEPQFIDFLYKCLAWMPEDRLDVRAALNHPWIAGVSSATEEYVKIKIRRRLNLHYHKTI